MLDRDSTGTLIYANVGFDNEQDGLTLFESSCNLIAANQFTTQLSDEIRALDAWIRKNTTEKFGPVRAVKPEHVFELGFEGIQVSPRHKSGVAVRFPRILRWRTDKRVEDADTLDTLKSLMADAAKHST